MKKSLRLQQLISFICLLFLSLNSYSNPIWYFSEAESELIKRISSVEASAEVNVSDGKRYNTISSWQSKEYSIFNLNYPDRKVILGKEGLYYWSSDGEKQTDGDEALRDFIYGHQFHAEIIFPDNFVKEISNRTTPSKECKCNLKTAIDLDGNNVEYHLDSSTGKLKAKIIHNKKHGTIKNTYHDFVSFKGLHLPRKILINHAGRDFVYLFNSIDFNTNNHYKSLRTPMSNLTDEQQIRRLHQDMIDAHIHSDINLMKHFWADTFTSVNRGKVEVMNKEKAIEQLGISLSKRRHTKYIDLMLPKIEFSEDKTMALLVVRVRLEGNSIDEKGKPGSDFGATFAWMATFKKIKNEWKMTAVVSNMDR